MRVRARREELAGRVHRPINVYAPTQPADGEESLDLPAEAAHG